MEEEAWGGMYSSLQSDGSKVVVNADDDEQDEIGCCDIPRRGVVKGVRRQDHLRKPNTTKRSLI